MPPKKDKGKAKEDPISQSKPKTKGLTNVRSWLNVTKPNQPIIIGDDSSSTNKLQKQIVPNTPSESPMFAPDSIDPNLVAAIAAALSQSQSQSVDKPEPILALPPTTAGNQVKLPIIQKTEVMSVPSSSRAIVPLKQDFPKSRFSEKPIFKYIYI